MKYIYLIVLCLCMQPIQAQETIALYEKPMENLDYRLHDLILSLGIQNINGQDMITSVSTTGVKADNATMCAKMCDQVLLPKPCVAFVYHVKNFTGMIDNVPNQTIHEKTCFLKSSTQNQIQRDGAFKFYSYKSTVRSFAPQNPAPMILLLSTVIVTLLSNEMNKS